MDGKFLIDAAAQTPLPQPFPVYQKKPARPVLSQWCSVCSEPAPCLQLRMTLLKQALWLNQLRFF